MNTEDRFAGFDYSRLINWERRLKREWPFLDSVLGEATPSRVLDLGSGTGEHARLLASKGFAVVGLDSSPAMVERSRATSGSENVEFIEGDMLDPAAVAGTGFGAALCLGNALPLLTGERDVEQFAVSLREAVVRGGPVIIQLLNYERIESKHERALPLSFLPDPDDPSATIVFLRAMELERGPGRRVLFMPTILRMRTDAEPPMELVSSRRVEIRAWSRGEIENAFLSAGFASFEAVGGYDRSPFEPAESRDLICVMR